MFSYRKIFCNTAILVLACAQMNLFAPKGSGSSMDGRDSCNREAGYSVCLGSQDCSRDSNWGCVVSGDPRSGHGDYGSGGNSSGGNGGGSGYDGTVAAPGMSSAASAIVSQEVEAQILSERYVTPNGKVCTKAQVIAAAKELSGVVVDALKDKYPSLILKGLIAPFFGEEIVDLDCAFAKKAVIEKSAEEIKQEISARKQAAVAPKRLSAVLLLTATTIHGGIYNLPSAEREALSRQFGGDRWLIRAIELASKRCASHGRRHGFCYAANHDRSDLIAKYDAMTQEQLNAWENNIIDLIRRERARGAC